ncbi:MAG: DUF4913 domain-containing protein [Microbacteriaceae bacterium]|nr:DUF4913 domain-containing protein [Microbacteriaceae bacterium]
MPPRRGPSSSPDRPADVGEAGTSPSPSAPPRPGAGAGETPQPELYFGNVDEFVREKLRYLYARRVSPQGGARWAAEWWRYPEAISRLDALWRAWEALRLEPTFGISTWWRDHADHHMRMLMNPDGPFADSQDKNAGDGDPLPYTAPPAGMFVDVRTL